MEGSDIGIAHVGLQRTSIGSSCSDNDIGTRIPFKLSCEWQMYNANETNPAMAKALATQILDGRSLQKALATLFQSCGGIKDGKLFDRVWSKFYTDILPNLLAVLYPFEEYAIHTSISGILLSTFRDQILTYDYFNGVVFKTPAVQRILLILEQNTRDNSANYWKLRKICDESFEELGIWDTAPAPDDGRVPRRKLAISHTARLSSEIIPVRVMLLKKGRQQHGHSLPRQK